MKNKKSAAFLLTAVLSFSVLGCENAGSAQTEERTESGEIKAVFLKEGQEAGFRDEIHGDGCIWVIDSIELTKELGSRVQSDFQFWGEETDEAGNLIGDQSYLFVTLSCRNGSGAVKEVLLNANGFVAADEEGKLSETGSEARYISKKQEGNDSPEKVFHYMLQDGEAAEGIEIGYIIEDSLLDDADALYYCVGNQGSQLENPENRYVKVEQAQ